MTSCIVVDDDQDTVNVFCDMLCIIEIEVLATANDGNQAVIMYKKHHPDIVFTDLSMPKYDGFYAIEKIKNMNPDAKIVAVTADSTAKESLFLESLNVTVISKPFEIQEIRQTISKLCTSDKDQAQFKIQYKFNGEDTVYSCTVNYEQYKNFKELPIVEKCEIIKKSKKQFDKYADEMRKAINLAIRNDTSHIRRLSDMVT
ncbi:response regulator [Nitrosarchaeum sp. AC2]|uniref:response regulator n=1 Tax=Nitrosarchaeum sp. AC2 TaxID=2259673 RepID=UPI0015CCC1E8|nr:response regulator [Nitrosarchaeum sp. AC2]QLH11243.1 response regulator [Nitrosarchaeum sp. AC2]